VQHGYDRDRWDHHSHRHGHHGYHSRYHHPHSHRYPYYHRYGYYRPYYYRPSYVHYYPYFVPTFGFGLGLSYWSTPAYYESYYATPTVVYTQPATVVETTPVYGGTTWYAETPTYVDSGTSYVETTPTVETRASGTYMEGQYIAAPDAPATAQPRTATAPAATPPPAEPTAPPREPDPRVLAAVGQGNEHFGAGRYADARRSYGEAMAADATDGVAMLMYGLASFAESDYAAAAGSVRQGLDATPDLIWYPFNVKALYRNDGRFQEHVAALARFVDSQPGNVDAQFLLGYMWYASGDAVSARTMFGGLSASHPSDELFMALRDASTQAVQAMSQQPAQGTVDSDTATVPVLPVPRTSAP
jgi:tetratricopeptide (TPR) repeat protein